MERLKSSGNLEIPPYERGFLNGRPAYYKMTSEGERAFPLEIVGGKLMMLTPDLVLERQLQREKKRGI